MNLIDKQNRIIQKQKLGALFGIGIIAGALITGCDMQRIQYQGKDRPIGEVQEMLEDYLESENPNMEFNVKITEDIGD